MSNRRKGDMSLLLRVLNALLDYRFLVMASLATFACIAYKVFFPSLDTHLIDPLISGTLGLLFVGMYSKNFVDFSDEAFPLIRHILRVCRKVGTHSLTMPHPWAKLAFRFLPMKYRKDYVDEIEEEFQKILTENGPKVANRYYWAQVISAWVECFLTTGFLGWVVTLVTRKIIG